MDNFDNNINNNLEDKAWASMKVLLDKELPEVAILPISDIDSKEKKKRRFLFFYLFLFGLIGTGLGYYMYAHNNDLIKNKNELKNNIVSINKINKIDKNSHSNDVILPKKEENTEGVTSENNKPIQLNKSVNNLNNNKLINPKNNTILTENENSQIIDNQSVIIEKNIDLNSKNNTQNQSIIELNKPNIVVEKDINSNIKSDVNSANLIQNSVIIIKENNIAIEPKIVEKEEPYITSIKPISSTELIDILKPKSIYFDNKNELNKEYKLLKSINKINVKNWSYGLVLGLNTEGSVNTLGGVVGGFLQRDLSTKWSINLGLNYRVLPRNESENVRKVEYLQSAEFNLDKLSVSTASSGIIRVNKAYLQNLQYLEIPIQINYHINPKIYFFSGGKIAYLASQNVAQSGTDNPLYVSVSAVYNVKSTERIIADKNYTSNDLGLNKWDLGLIGGVNYRINNHFLMELHCDLGLYNIYQTNIYQTGSVITANNRFVGLNVAYRF